MISDALTDCIQRVNNLLDGPMYDRATFGDDGLLNEIHELVGIMDAMRKRLDVPPVCQLEGGAQH